MHQPWAHLSHEDRALYLFALGAIDSAELRKVLGWEPVAAYEPIIAKKAGE